MSEPVETSLPEVSEALGTDGQGEVEELVDDHGDHSGEESDVYDEDIDEELGKHFVGNQEEEEEDDEEEEEDDNERKEGLTALLLGDPNAADEEEEEEEEAEDEEYVEEAPIPTPSGGKKRTLDEAVEDADQDASEESEAKKVKA